MTNKGQEGEIQVGLALARLPRGIYHDIHNATFEGDDGTTQVDHVVVSRYGIFVVETKNYSGTIYGLEKEKTWTQVRRNGEKHTFQNPIRQNWRHIKVLSGLLRVKDSAFHTLIAFCGDAVFKTPLPDCVMQSGYDKYIRTKTEVRLADADVHRVVEQIKASMLPRGEETDQKHLESLNRRFSQKAERNAKTTQARQGVGGGRRRENSTPAPANVLSKTGRRGWPNGRTSGNLRNPTVRYGLTVVAMIVVGLVAIPLFQNMIEGIAKSRIGAVKQLSLPQQAPRPAATEVFRQAPDLPSDKSAEAAKEAAWQRYYQRPPGCDGPSANIVECGNHYIRARREFEQAFEAGTVR